MRHFTEDHPLLSITLSTLFVISCITFLAVVITHGVPTSVIFPILTGIAIWLGNRK